MTEPSERDLLALELRGQGQSFPAIGRAIGVSKSRAAQIVYKTAHRVKGFGVGHRLYAAAVKVLEG